MDEVKWGIKKTKNLAKNTSGSDVSNCFLVTYGYGSFRSVWHFVRVQMQYFHQTTIFLEHCQPTLYKRNYTISKITESAGYLKTEWDD